MTNIALGRLPIEKEKWDWPHEATNGNISTYDGGSGFAASNWPCTYTLDLEKEFRISLIRILLWDHNGSPLIQKDDRKYRFSLSISTDGISYVTVFSNENQDGGNGWFTFRFTSETYARFVKFIGFNNTVNEGIHIVEFEIHDQEPPQLLSNNIHEFNIATGIGLLSEEKMNELIVKVLSKKSSSLDSVDDKIKQLDNAILQSSQALKQIDLIKQSNDYTTEAIHNNIRAKRWLIASSIALFIFVIVLLWFVFWDKHSTKIIQDSSSDVNVKPFITLLLGAFYASKAILISTILFILSWLLKNYRSEKHNYVVNKHKAMTLTVATGILTKDDYNNTDKGNIFIQAMDIIFTHQVSGFSKEDVSSPNIINSLLQKGMPKGDIV